MHVVKVLLRNILPLVLAIGIALGLFWFMQWLIEPDAAEPIETLRGGLQRVDIQAPTVTPNTPTTASEAPPPPTALAEAAAALPVAPDLARPTTPTAELNFTPTSMPGLAINSDIQALATDGLDITIGEVPSAGNIKLGDFKGAEDFGGRKVIPISTRSPCFPKAAFERNIEGTVDVLFIVKSDGSVISPRVVDANPKGFFEAPAIEAVRTWYYDSKKLRGSSVEVLQTIPFTLDMFAFNGARKC